MKYNDKWAISEFEPKTDVLWIQPSQDEEDEGIKINAFVNGKWKAVSGNGGENYPPEDGIPKEDLDDDVQSSLSKADTAYQKPTTGIPASDLASGVQTSLGKADTALQTIKTVNGQSLVGSGDIEILEPGTIETLVIDGTPTAGSSNLITSGGVASEIVWDVTARNSNATFVSLSALLSDANLATLIPTTIRRGGMQIRFVHSNDNNYIQFRYMKSDASTNATFTNVANWQGVDEEPTMLSANLVTSGGVCSEVNREKLSLYGKVVVTALMRGNMQSVYYALPLFDFTDIGRVYNISVAVATGAVVWFYKTVNGTRTQIAALRNAQSVEVTIESGMSLIEIRSGESADITPTLTITTSGYIPSEINPIKAGLDATDVTVGQHQEALFGSVNSTFSFAASPGVVTYKPVLGVIYNVGNEYSIKATINEASKYVRVYTTTNGIKTLAAYLYNNQSYSVTIGEGMTAVELGSVEAVSGNVIVTSSIGVLGRVSSLESSITKNDLSLYPFASDATFKKSTNDYSYIRESIKGVAVYGCRYGCTYYVRDLYKNTGRKYLEIYEKNGEVEKSHALINILGNFSSLTDVESLETDNLRIVIDWSKVTITSGVNYYSTTAPIHSSCLDYLPESDIEILLPKNIRVATGTELSIYKQMLVSNVREDKIRRVNVTNFTEHERFCRYIPTDSSSGVNNAFANVHLFNYNKGYTQKLFNLHPIKSTVGGNKTLNVLCIGGSTTEQGYYIDYLKNMFDADNYLSINLLGTVTSTAGQPCEGRSGWRARTYFCQDGTADGKPQATNPFFNSNYSAFSTDAFDFSMYMTNQGYAGCDVVIFAFGGNDSANNETDLGYAHTYYDAMIASFKAYNPDIIIGIWMYNGGYYFYDGNTLQIDERQKLHKYILDWYDDREDENIFILPISLNVDPLYDYPYREVNTSARNSDFKEIEITDFVHVAPSTGAYKLADVCYSYIKYFSTLVE